MGTDNPTDFKYWKDLNKTELLGLNMESTVSLKNDNFSDQYLSMIGPLA